VPFSLTKLGSLELLLECGRLATVITSLATAIPVVGKSIMYWLWGGFSVDNPTLNRFYSFHYTLPFILAGLSVFHIAALHQYGSTNPLGINSQSSSIAFGVYFGVKDMLGALFLAMLFSYLVFFNPDLLGHPDNLIPANPYSTPQHIVPEWYVLWIYALLRSIPNKAMGVLAVLLVFVALAIQPLLNTSGGRFRVASEFLYWCFVADLFLLTWLGAQEITPVSMFVGQCCTGFLFGYLLILVPVISLLEHSLLYGDSRAFWRLVNLIGVLVFVGFCFYFSSVAYSSFVLLQVVFVLPPYDTQMLNKRNGKMEDTLFAIVLSGKGWIPLQMTSHQMAGNFMAKMSLSNIPVKLVTGQNLQSTMDVLNKSVMLNLSHNPHVPSDLTGIYANLPSMSTRISFNKTVMLTVASNPVLLDLVEDN
jgi:hypothetical protein